MLNTKPIKKSSNIFDNRIPNLSSDTKNTDNKVILLAGSKQEELENMVKQANEDIQSEHNQNNINNIEDVKTGGIGGDAHSNLQIHNPVVNREFTYDRYKDKNLNVSNLIDGNKMFIGNVETLDANQSQYQMKLNHNPIQKNEFGETVKINWNDIDNCYVISNVNSGTIECRIFNENILKYIVSNEINDIGIKRYLFIIGWNNQTEIFEFNFVDSVFTSNFDIMIKLQNWTYDTLKNFDNLDVSDTYNYQEAIMMFYFQLVIYLFNNFEKYSVANESSKISRIYSCIVYRFSSLVLKNVLNMKNLINSNNVVLNDLMALRSDIFSQINFINNKLEQYKHIKNNRTETLIDITNTSDEYETDGSRNSISSRNSDTSRNSRNSVSSRNSKKYKIVNGKKKLTETETETDDKTYTSDKNITKMDYINKNGEKIKKIKEFITDELQINTDNINSDDNSEEYDSEKNGYFEIDDPFANFNDIDDGKNKKHNINNLVKLVERNDINKVIPVENSVISQIKSYTNGSKERSYNPNSAIKNSKIFEIPI